LGLGLCILGTVSGDVCCVSTALAAVAVWDYVAETLLPLSYSADGPKLGTCVICTIVVHHIGVND
jgi:hypothetical protein